MRRVLAANGRVGLSVWRHIEYTPGYLALAEALEPRVGEGTGAAAGAPFCLSDFGELRDLLASAGFRDVRARPGRGSVRFPSGAEFLLRYTASYPPLTGLVGALGGKVRKALVYDLGEALRGYTDDTGLVFFMEAYIALALR